jgi:predicted transcriptional regulator
MTELPAMKRRLIARLEKGTATLDELLSLGVETLRVDLIPDLLELVELGLIAETDKRFTLTEAGRKVNV